MSTNLCEKPAAIIFYNGMIIEYDQPDIWLSEHLTVGASGPVRPRQFPRSLDDSMHEAR